MDPVSGATASIYDNPADDLYRLDPWRVVTWMYGTVAGWTEWRFDLDANLTARPYDACFAASA